MVGDQAEELNRAGIALAQQGKFDEATGYFRQALILQPNFARAHYNLGVALQSQAKMAEASACYRRAIAIQPDYADAHANLGTALSIQGHLGEACACFERALTLNPNDGAVAANLGSALQGQGKLVEAVASYRLAVLLGVDSVPLYKNLGAALTALGQHAEARACFLHVVRQCPDDAAAHNDLGLALKEMGNLSEALTSFRRALQIDPCLAAAENNLACVLHGQGNIDDALAGYRRALALAPGFAEVYSNLATALLSQGQPLEAVACCRKALHLQPDLARAQSNLLYMLWFCPGLDARAIYEEHRRWNKTQVGHLPCTPHANDAAPDRRLRVGYISPDLRDHVVGRNILPLLRHHDHEHFHITLYAHSPRPDQSAVPFQQCADRWRDITRLPDAEVAETIRQDEIDVLVDLALHMDGNRLAIFARRPAPVQVTFAGYPGTTGLGAINYRLTDPWLDPTGLFEGCYSEASIRLPHSFWCYHAGTADPPPTVLPALENGYITFGCLNNTSKLNEEALHLWARVLRAVDQARLLLLARSAGFRRQTRDTFGRLGIAAERIEFALPGPRPEYLALYQRIDIGLDTVPYNGHTTSLDSLWMGVPVISLAGQTVVGRAGVSQLTNVGLPELIAGTEDEFVQIAVNMTKNLVMLADLRGSLRTRMTQSPIMNAAHFAAAIEAAYRAMWHRWCAGKGER